MAESSSSVVPGDVEWLPGPGGTRLLRIHPPSPEPPVLILQLAGGDETRLEAGTGPHTQYEIPGELDWDAAWLVWPDGSRAVIPAPHGREAQVIELRPRRFRPSSESAAPTRDPSPVTRESSRPARDSSPATREPSPVPRDPSSAADGPSPATRDSSRPARDSSPATRDPSPAGRESSPAAREPSPAATRDSSPATRDPSPAATRDSSPATREPSPATTRDSSPATSRTPGEAPAIPRGFIRVPPAVPRAEGPAGPSWITPPQLAAGPLVEGDWQERQEEVERELARASAAITRAREGERLARDAVLGALTAARADLRAARAARDADASAFAAIRGELEAERSAHAVTRGSIGTLADALAAARAELTAARETAELAKQAGQEARATVASARREAALARAEAASLRAALEAERAARERAETELRGRAGLIERVADLDRDAAGLRDQVELERRAREQAEAAAAAARRPPEEANRLRADLDAAAAALRATTSPDAAAPAAVSPPATSPDAAAPDATSPPAATSAVPGVPAEADATLPAAAAPAEADATSSPTDTSPDAAAPDASSPPTATSPDAAAPDASSPPTATSPDAAAPDATAPPAATSAVTGAPAEADATSPPTATSPDAAAPDASSPPTATSPDSAAVSPLGDAAAPSTALVPADTDRRLRKALIALSREDAGAAGALLVGLLPAQGAVLEGSLSYDVTVRGIGTFGVFVEDGSARVVRLSRKRPRGQALFHLSGDPETLAELLAGERDKLPRFRRQGRVTGRRKRAREELAPLQAARLSLAEAVKAGARLEPGLVYRALPFAIEPEWTKGHAFTVAQQIVELAPHSWHVSARDGLPLRVVERAIDAPADATVTMSRAAFERLLKGEPQPRSDRPQVRGDRDAVAALKRWTDLARGV